MQSSQPNCQLEDIEDLIGQSSDEVDNNLPRSSILDQVMNPVLSLTNNKAKTHLKSQPLEVQKVDHLDEQMMQASPSLEWAEGLTVVTEEPKLDQINNTQLNDLQQQLMMHQQQQPTNTNPYLYRDSIADVKVSHQDLLPTNEQ